MRWRRCLIPGCRSRAYRAELPLVGRAVWVCNVHRGARFIAVMRELIPHG